MKRIAVLGPGGVGGFIAAALARAGQDVSVIAREATAGHIARHGVQVQSVRLGDFVAHPHAETSLERPAEFLIIATKAPGLTEALGRVRARCGLVVPLLNGIEHMAALRERLGFDRVAAGVIRIESDSPAPGQVVQSSPSVRVDLASDDPALGDPVRALAQILESAGVPARIEGGEAQVLWSKLVRLNALACTTSASQRPIGFIRSDPHWRAELEGCIYETAAVARAEGADIDPAARLAELDEPHPGLGSSLQRDIAAGRESELDAIPGAVLRAARSSGTPGRDAARLVEQIARQAGISPPRV